MSRLTYQKRDGNYSIRFDLGNLQQVDIKAMNKLGKLEDIEEELKVDLIALFAVYNKLCEQKFVYFKIDGEIKKHYPFGDSFVIDFKNKEIIGIEYEPDIWLSFKDYGIIWALNREELEENDR